MPKIFYISDIHAGHFNIIRFDNRPFSSIEEMDNLIIKNWNNTVTDEDTVYMLGDVSWYKNNETVEFLKKLNGKKILIRGNHDRVSPQIARCFEKVCDYLEVSDNGTRVVMSHYPIPFWNGQFRDSVHLYGHVHNSHQWNIVESWIEEARALQDIPMRAYNVGCMMPYISYTPKTLSEIEKGYNDYRRERMKNDIKKPKEFCDTCRFFLGLGDWNLCCSKPHPEFPCGFLCYKDTPACDMYQSKNAEEA